jgi:hypothetical protein
MDPIERIKLEFQAKDRNADHEASLRELKEAQS